MKISFEGFNANYLTFIAAEGLEGASPGTLVKLTADSTVDEAIDDGDVFIGSLVSEKDGVACVQVSGYAETEAALAAGFHRVAFTDGALDESETGREIFVVSSDNGKIGFIM